jgi:plasmid maintenance system antidote protein VapI
MERPVQTVNEIIRAVKAITPETALQIERVLGTPAYIWVRLEADYRLDKARLEASAREADRDPDRPRILSTRARVARHARRHGLSTAVAMRRKK